MDQFRQEGDNPPPKPSNFTKQNDSRAKWGIWLIQNNVSYYVWTDMCRFSHSSSKYYPAFTMNPPGAGPARC